MPVDSFSGKPIQKGQGLMYVKKDGTIYWFASRKSEKNFLKLRRIPSKTKWTETYHKEKGIRVKAAKGKAAEAK
ncbi:50S ribosomal protein L24e [uncultured archaeon]|nr:50S ribosomal protein L24e [uncultured archaeon]